MDYTPLRISTVKPLRMLTFDLYIHFKDQYLCYVKNGEQLSDEKFQKLKSQKIAKFYITEQDEFNYQNFLDSLLEETLSNPITELEEKINMVEGAASSAIERMNTNPTQSALNATVKAAKSLQQVMTNNPDALKKIFGKIADENEEIIQHSLNVCVLSLKLAEFRGCSEQEMDNLGTAALIHDIGLTNLSKVEIAFFMKPKKSFTNEDKRVYYLHCKDAGGALREKTYMTPAVLELILNHEEVQTGLGPNKKKKLSLLEEILSMANNYDKRTLTNKTSPSQTLKDMMIDELGNYDIKLMNDFKKILQKEGLI